MSNTSWNTTSYNPITGYTNYPGAWIYNYINNPSIATNNWVNTNMPIAVLYVIIVGQGGLAGGSGGYSYGGPGGGGGGQVVLLQFNNVQVNDQITITFNEYDAQTTSNAYCNLIYYNSSGVAQDLTQIGAYYYATPDYATGTTASSIKFNSSLFKPIAEGNKLLFNSNTSIKTYYGGFGETYSSSSDSYDGADGGNGGGGSGGGGGAYSIGTNGSRGNCNVQPGTYGGMKGGDSSSSSQSRYGGCTIQVMPDSTNTVELGKGGNGGDGGGALGDNGSNGSLMIFYSIYNL